MSKLFGWDYPPGCSGPPEAETTCKGCGAETNYGECGAEIETCPCGGDILRDPGGWVCIKCNDSWDEQPTCQHYNESPYEAREREMEERADSEENIYGRRSRWWRRSE